MLTIPKKYIVDEQGRPQEVIIPWEQYQQISEVLGLDLDEKAIADLRQAQHDRATKNQDAYVSYGAALRLADLKKRFFYAESKVRYFEEKYNTHLDRLDADGLPDNAGIFIDGR